MTRRLSPAGPTARVGAPSTHAAWLLSPAAQLLFLCAGPASPSRDAQLRRVGGEGVRWEELLTLARVERAVPVTYEGLRLLPKGTVPDDVLARFARLSHVEFFRAMHRRERLVGVLAAFERAGIEVMLLKGAAMAVAVYGDFGARPMSDLDLLVRADQAREAHALLRAAGWRTDDDVPPAGVYEEHHHLPPLHDDGTPPLYLELHTGLLAGSPLGLTRAMLERDARTVAFTGRAVRVPSAAHMLLHACGHYAWGHMLRGASWRTFRDLAALVAAGDIDWPAFLVQARETRAETCCYWTFRLARALSGISVPADVERALRPALPDAILDRLEQHFMLQTMPGGRLACPSVRLEKWLWELAIGPTRSGHGPTRPWDHSDAFQNARTSPDQGWRKVVHHAGAVVRWARYGRAVVGSPPRTGEGAA